MRRFPSETPQFAMLVPFAITALLLVPQEGAAETPSLPLVREGDHFRVHCHLDAPAVADGALDAVEALFPAAEPLYGDGPRETLLDVHLYPDPEAFRRADQEITGGEFAQNLAFAHFATRSAHVAMQPPVTREVLDRFGLPQLTAELLAHEAAHLLRFDAMPNFRSHPDWFIDGAASWLSREAIGALGYETDPAVDPEAGRAIGILRQMEELPEFEDVFRTPLEDLGFYQRYAATELWFEFLMEEESRRLTRAVDAVRERGGGDPRAFASGIYDEIEDIFGSRLRRIDARFADWLEDQEAGWFLVYRSLERREVDGADEWLMATFGSKNAIAWRSEPVESKRFAVRGTAEILEGPRRQLNVLLGDGPEGFLQVCFTAEDSVVLLRYDRDAGADSAWQRLGASESALPAEFAFEVEADGDTLRIEIDGETFLEVEDVPAPLTGRWGLGALAGSAGVWSDLEGPGM